MKKHYYVYAFQFDDNLEGEFVRQEFTDDIYKSLREMQAILPTAKAIRYKECAGCPECKAAKKKKDLTSVYTILFLLFIYLMGVYTGWLYLKDDKGCECKILQLESGRLLSFLKGA